MNFRTSPIHVSPSSATLPGAPLSPFFSNSNNNNNNPIPGKIKPVNIA